MLGIHIFKVQKLGRGSKREQLIITLYDPLDFRKYLDEGYYFTTRTLFLRPISPLVAELSVDVPLGGKIDNIVITKININTLWVEIEQFLTDLKTANITDKYIYKMSNLKKYKKVIINSEIGIGKGNK